MLHVFTIILDYAAFCSIILVTGIVVKVLYNLYLHPLRHYPGPRLWAATRLTWTCSMQSGNFHRHLRDLHDRYGPVVRIAPDELSYTDARAWKDIYGNRNIFKNRIWAGQEEATHPLSIVSTDEATHVRNRRALMGAFTEHAVIEHAPILESLVDTMIQNFKQDAIKNQGRIIVNISDWLNFLAFDISGALSFGESFGSVKQGYAHPWVEISCSFGKGIAMMASINYFRPLDKLMKYVIPAKVLEKMQYHKQLVHEKLMQRLAMEHKAKSQDFVGSIMAYNEEKGEVKIPMDEVEANMTVLIFAGSETTATAMVSIFMQLLKNPERMERVQKEIRDAFATEEDIKIANLSHLDYLTAVIEEGIRLGPPAAVGQPRVTPKEGEMIAGKWVPGNTYLAVNQFPTFRSATNFTNPDSFIPERFLPSSPYPNDKIASFEPFLLGRHKCVGQKLAWAEMRITLARILYAFDIKATVPPGDFGDQRTFIFWEKKKLDIELRPREECL
ncbi:benzoate 4-monooxygenase cytochrome-like protein P450 [Aaosphaeria arxii CBS 175.79]|uniref:Benzoate 4-monooxygenase cytochrome-like protein P450 n=1 Tax=Aaosphaeria arxii CBS 175.79 TaxID=1450172 RepID=A0A6A5XCU1_9PLEO|nr:benzoate 4-monooxygenase cytochrome-like protein P450 [Aaosphaeria arxii CBS 175.79]KAF2010740.1 benzoate 4-monooxygenase cytochrome-like protein P450 [Aaosphaeria arxii CBS 175.79]